MSDMKTISIHGLEFSAPQPYSEGHTLSAIEAKVLNQCFAENIANNQRKNIKAALEGGNGAPTLEEARAAFDAYAADYQFTEAGVGGARSTVTPVEKEARRIARLHIMNHLKSVGKAKKDVNKDRFEAEVAKIAATEQVQKLAKKRVKEMDQLALDEMEDVAA